MVEGGINCLGVNRVLSSIGEAIAAMRSSISQILMSGARSPGWRIAPDLSFGAHGDAMLDEEGANLVDCRRAARSTLIAATLW
jgi:hypothetical protein